jgi:hypothetical protein
MSQSEWAEMKDVYDINKAKSNDKLKTMDSIANRPDRNISDDVKTFISDIMRDTSTVTSQSSTLFEWLTNVWTVLTIGNRGVILGTLLIVVSLSLLATMPKTDGTP